MTNPRVRINWTIPAPVIIAILVQAATILVGIAIWKTTIEKTMEQDRLTTDAQFKLVDSRMTVLERSVANNAQVVERVTRVEAQVGGLKEQSTRIENKLDTALERRR